MRFKGLTGTCSGAVFFFTGGLLKALEPQSGKIRWRILSTSLLDRLWFNPITDLFASVCKLKFKGIHFIDELSCRSGDGIRNWGIVFHPVRRDTLCWIERYDGKAEFTNNSHAGKIGMLINLQQAGGIGCNGLKPYKNIILLSVGTLIGSINFLVMYRQIPRNLPSSPTDLRGGWTVWGPWVTKQYLPALYWVSLPAEGKWYDCPGVYPYGIVYYRFDGRQGRIRSHPVPRITSMQGDTFPSLFTFGDSLDLALCSKTSCRFVSLLARLYC